MSMAKKSVAKMSGAKKSRAKMSVAKKSEAKMSEAKKSEALKSEGGTSESQIMSLIFYATVALFHSLKRSYKLSDLKTAVIFPTVKQISKCLIVSE